MQLSEWIEQRKQLLEDFKADYERQRKRKTLTMFRPSEQWTELYDDFHEIYAEPEPGIDNRDDFPNQADQAVRTR